MGFLHCITPLNLHFYIIHIQKTKGISSSYDRVALLPHSKNIVVSWTEPFSDGSLRYSANGWMDRWRVKI